MKVFFDIRLEKQPKPNKPGKNSVFLSGSVDGISSFSGYWFTDGPIVTFERSQEVTPKDLWIMFVFVFKC